MNTWSAPNPQHTNNKPMEIYLFIDPFCTDCWALSPIIKKLQLEYGDYFILKYVLCGQITSLNNKNKKDLIHSKKTVKNCQTDPFMYTPHLAAISIKAAELQGKRAGIRFIRRLQEMLFMENADITDINVIQQCAKNADLDLDEFIGDIYSQSAAKAFQCDLKITSEMEVSEMPAMVFFNENIEDEGLKITGLYSYDIYVQILTEMLEGYPKPAEMPPLELFLTSNPINATHDLAVIYDQSPQQIERQMKQLQLQQKAQKIHAKNGPFWKYNSSRNQTMP
ncbi:ClpXP adapter SpxH family protein [Lederbergia citrea]|uniref:ClpXP adapter protein SpxH n=1 Tax=Lederbergia citrea TaxID=2833581 RepID=A0A942Z3G6_9BACI|nr:ClpXP adapter SpxH family protein [Lederbergia citrea]MBS4177397.1 DsbA family protein [Lederbergia citrea]MBS4204075.1 DsbA family protein [Lederbergia citrea]MBS4221340.1 DsbA family protein [Lederbergia citrea]